MSPQVITMRTEIARAFVEYAVLVDGREIWRRKIAIGTTDRFSPGGPAFVAAAREQESRAHAAAADLPAPRCRRCRGCGWEEEGDTLTRCRVCDGSGDAPAVSLEVQS